MLQDGIFGNLAITGVGLWSWYLGGVQKQFKLPHSLV